MAINLSPQRLMKNLLREPLVHFLLLGLALFALNAYWAANAGGEQRIVVSQARVTTLTQNFARTWQRQPSASELDGLIEEYIRDEILTNEALRLGLDRDDTVIRRRLRQKLEIITEESAASANPTDSELDSYRQVHADTFRGEARFAFEQVFFDPTRRGEQLSSDIERARSALNNSIRRATAADFSTYGDALFVLQPRYALTGERAIASSFGNAFVTALSTLKADVSGQWQGPIESGYGLHLVRITGREAGANLPLADVRPLVEREWRNAQRNRARDAHYQSLRATYRIDIAKPKATP